MEFTVWVQVVLLPMFAVRTCAAHTRLFPDAKRVHPSCRCATDEAADVVKETGVAVLRFPVSCPEFLAHSEFWLGTNAWVSATNRGVIEHLRRVAPGHHYATSMAPPAAQQIVSALRLIRGEDGSDRGARKIAALHANSNWFRRRLIELGCNVLGDWDSPVMARAHTCPNLVE